MMDDGLFVAARCVENKTRKDFQRCISLHKQLQQSSSSCKSQLGVICLLAIVVSNVGKVDMSTAMLTMKILQFEVHV